MGTVVAVKPSSEPTRIFTVGRGPFTYWLPVLAASAQHVFLSLSSEGIWRMRHDGSEACIILPGVCVQWMTVLGDQLVYVREADDEDDAPGITLWMVPVAGGSPREVSRDLDGFGIAADDDGLVWTVRGKVRYLARGEHEPSTVKRVRALDPANDEHLGATPRPTIALDRGQLYWLDYDRRADDISGAPWQIWRRDLRGSSREKIADAKSVSVLVALGGRACWLDTYTGLAVGGQPPTFAIPIDADGHDELHRAGRHLVFRSNGKPLLLLGDGPPRLIPAPAPDEHWVGVTALPDALALATYVGGPNGNSVWRVPLSPPPPMTLVGVDDAVIDLCTADGDLLTVSRRDADEADDDEADDADDERGFEVWLRDARGSRYDVFRADRIARIASDGETVAVAHADGEGGATSIVLLEEDDKEPCRIAARGDEIRGLALRPQTVAWIADETLWVVLRSRGALVPRSVARVEGRGRRPLIVIDGAVYFSGSCAQVRGVHRSRNGGAAELLWRSPHEPLGRVLIRIGRDQVLVSGARTHWRIPTDGGQPTPIYSASAERGIARIVAGAGRVYMCIKRTSIGAPARVEEACEDGEQSEHNVSDDELVWIDPVRVVDAPRLVLWPAQAIAEITADDIAVYLILRDSGWIVRIPHPRS